jgi:hypothetical protein
MNCLRRVFGSSNRITVRNPFVVESPKIGFLSLVGAPGQLALEEDKAALGISSGNQAYLARLETLQSQ